MEQGRDSDPDSFFLKKVKTKDKCHGTASDAEIYYKIIYETW